MRASLGVRISGVLLAGSLAIAVTALVDDGGSAGGRGHPGVAGGPSAGGRAGDTAQAASPGPSASGRQAPDGGRRPVGPIGSTGSDRTGGGSGSPGGSDDAGGVPSPTTPPSPTPSDAPTTPLTAPAWLPPGPGSPDTDQVPDPAGVYDVLRTPARCQEALGTIVLMPPDDDWRLLRGLANACLAIEGRGGSWEVAAREHAALAGQADTCKGRAASAVLGGLLDFHRRHPGATVRLETAPGGAAACEFGIGGVDVGEDGEARPGDTVVIELRGAHFDPAELVRYGSVSLGGSGVPPLLRSASGDRIVLTAVVPVLEPGPADVLVTYGDAQATLEDAFAVAPPAQVPSSGTPALP